jgi:hypothetical protein
VKILGQREFQNHKIHLKFKNNRHQKSLPEVKNKKILQSQGQIFKENPKKKKKKKLKELKKKKMIMSL